MATTWIVAADSSRARVLQVAGREPTGVPASDRETQGEDLSSLNERELERYFAQGSGRAP
jgi:hypothetical protein